MKRKRRKPKLVPRLGPAQNLRPAGAHESRKLYNRKRRHKAALEDYVEDGFIVCCAGLLRASSVSSASTTAAAII